MSKENCTCKDCLHYQVCADMTEKFIGAFPKSPANGCSQFLAPDSLVKRGRWVLQMGGPHSDIRMYHCSECGFELPYNPKKMPAFCEDCGALMED